MLTMAIDARLGCSTISFRHLALPDALAVITDLGFAEIDLGALPGVCDHVPYELTADAVREVAAVVNAAPLRVRSVNGDIGDLNRPLDAGQRAERDEHLARLLELTAAIGAQALVLPCGAQQHDPISDLGDGLDLDRDLNLVAAELIRAAVAAARAGVELWVEGLHYFRLCWNLDRARALADRLTGHPIGLVLDVSHVVASGASPEAFIDVFGERIVHVHLRDAEAGYIHHSIGRGEVDFPATYRALTAIGYPGHSALELETRDVSNDERPAAAAAAAAYITELFPATTPAP
jgi:sugar phosphate isomerase/epimerase